FLKSFKIQITPYGLCHYHFSKPQDQIFRRQISDCKMDGIRNFTAIDDLTRFHYQQNIEYIQNTRIRADIIKIMAEEKLSFTSSLIQDWSLIMETQ
ncbi:unnamed protein product, partial [Thelazia callipaeda]|uniref:Glycosyl transferase family 2 n=1 Tax=Thelazia callipaeda TaxID=103827 RepID=A0A0N5CJ45_THECL